MKHNRVSKFLESVIYKSAFKLGLEPLEIWEDVKSEGRFVSFENGLLTFTYKNAVIELAL